MDHTSLHDLKLCLHSNYLQCRKQLDFENQVMILSKRTTVINPIRASGFLISKMLYLKQHIFKVLVLLDLEQKYSDPSYLANVCICRLAEWSKCTCTLRGQCYLNDLVYIKKILLDGKIFLNPPKFIATYKEHISKEHLL